MLNLNRIINLIIKTIGFIALAIILTLLCALTIERNILLFGLLFIVIIFSAYPVLWLFAKNVKLRLLGALLLISFIGAVVIEVFWMDIVSTYLNELKKGPE